VIIILPPAIYIIYQCIFQLAVTRFEPYPIVAAKRWDDSCRLWQGGGNWLKCGLIPAIERIFSKKSAVRAVLAFFLLTSKQ
jgi:hypothetical protein